MLMLKFNKIIQTEIYELQREKIVSKIYERIPYFLERLNLLDHVENNKEYNTHILIFHALTKFPPINCLNFSLICFDFKNVQDWLKFLDVLIEYNVPSIFSEVDGKARSIFQILFQEDYIKITKFLILKSYQQNLIPIVYLLRKPNISQEDVNKMVRKLLDEMMKTEDTEERR